MDKCFYCEDGVRRESLMIEVCKLKHSTVYLNRNQKYRGRCIVKLNRHKTEYFQMDKEERDGYFAELAATAKAVFELIIRIKLIMRLLEIWFPMSMYM